MVESRTWVGRFLRPACTCALLTLLTVSTHAQGPVAGSNVNMVSGTVWPDGDPFLQRQNEPSLAASTRNPMHLLAGANDYRTVDLPFPESSGLVTGDAWLGVFKSLDGGLTWRSTLLPGYPQDGSQEGSSSPIHGYDAGADPVVRAGISGLLYYTGLVFDREEGGKSAVFLARYIDNNNRELGDPIVYVGSSLVDSRPAGAGGSFEFLDKPWLAVDLPRSGAGSCTIVTEQEEGEPLVQTIPAGNVYVAYTAVGGAGTVAARLLFRRSTDCGVTWSAPLQLSEAGTISQGASLGIDPRDGTVYVAWRQFDPATVGAGTSFGGGAKKPTPKINVCHLPPDNPANGSVIQIAQSTLSSHLAHGDCTQWQVPEKGKCTCAVRGNAMFLARLSAGADGVEQRVAVRAIDAFEQGTSVATFRTNAFPSLAVDGSGRLYLAWSQRGVGPSGDARIVVATSQDRGATWTSPTAVDNPPKRGHQLMPTLTFGAGSLVASYYDQTLDHTIGYLDPVGEEGELEEVREPAGDLAAGLPERVFNQYIADAAPPSFNPALDPISRRHTLDLRAAIAAPGPNPVFTSTGVFDVLYGGLSERFEQLQFHASGLQLFSLGTVPFNGDYIDVATAPAFVPLSGGGWAYNLQAPEPVYQVSWTDNRDVLPPEDGDWTNYTPPNLGGDPTSVFDPLQDRPSCIPGQAGMRNQNVYSARLTRGLFVGALGNAKPLGNALAPDGTTTFLIDRGFVVQVQNALEEVRTYRLTIENQPEGGRASFSQFPLDGFPDPLVSIDVSIPPFSTISRTVYVKSTDENARVSVSVLQVTAPGGAVVPPSAGGLQGSVVLNPDPSNPSIANPSIANPSIANAEVYNPTTAAPSIANPSIANPSIANPDPVNPSIANIRIVNPSIANLVAPAPSIANPGVVSPSIANPSIANLDIVNASITDVTWELTNTGNTTTAYTVKLIANRELPIGFKSQLIIHKFYTTPIVDEQCALRLQTQNLLVASIPDPVFIDPASPSIANPSIANPSIANATVALAPEERAEVTLRVVDPDRFDAITFDGAASITPVGVSQSVNTEDILLGSTTPPIVVTLTATTITLPSANDGGAYDFQLGSIGGTGPLTWTIESGSLPPGVALLADGTLVGIPTATGAFTFTVRAEDAFGNFDFQQLTLTVAEAGVNTASATGNLLAPNSNHTSTRLADGRVLVAGGFEATPVTTAQIYDPTTGLFTATGSMNVARADPRAILLASGKVLIVGGGDGVSVLASAEIYDPATGTFTLTGSMSVPRSFPSAARLPDGRVMVASGSGGTPLQSAEIYDPVSGTFTPTGSLTEARVGGEVVLPDGRVLLAGGIGIGGTQTLASAEVYDPASGTFTTTGSLSVARNRFSRALLSDGRALFAGGNTTNLAIALTATAEVFDPGTGAFTPVGNMSVANMRAGGFFDAGTTLLNGKTIVPGGSSQAGPGLDSIEVFDPLTNTFALAGNLTGPRTGPSVTMLCDGRVLIAGGRSGAPLSTVLDTAEIFDPGPAPFRPAESKVTASDAEPGAQFGFGDVDGTIAVIGAFTDDALALDSGAAYVFRFDGTSWVEEAKLVPSDGATGEGFGFSTAVGGNTIVVSAFQDDGIGSAYVFRFDGTDWVQEAKLVPSDGEAGDQFGYVVDIANDTVVVGALLHDNSMGTVNAGAAYVYRFNGASWVEEQTLEDVDSGPGDFFGAWVSISGNAILVGAWGDDDNGPNSGSAYVFRFDGASWSEEEKLAASDAADFDRFGFSVAISGNLAVIGANGTDSGGGTAYIFRFDGTSWLQEADLVASDQALGDAFGEAVAIYGERAVIGARFDDAPGVDSGAAYFFEFDGSSWVEEAKLVPSDGEAGDELGTTVAVSGGTILVSAHNDDSFTGSAYFFDPPRALSSLSESSCPAGGPTGRALHGSSLLLDGRVLVSGGLGAAGGTASIYDPRSESFSATGGLNVARHDHESTLLSDGRVLLTGGRDGALNPVAASEIYDPATGTFSVTDSLGTARFGHTATRLANGSVLIAGGIGLSAELYDPATGSFSNTGSMTTARSGARATLLRDGWVLVVGGSGTSAELYDPSTGSFSATGSMNFARSGHETVLLRDGRVLVVGGSVSLIATAEIYDPATGTFSTTGDLAQDRFNLGATLLPNGKVLVAGGLFSVTPLNTTEIFDPSTGLFEAGPPMLQAREVGPGMLVLLGDGTVLISNAGGSSERFRP